MDKFIIFFIIINIKSDLKFYDDELIKKLGKDNIEYNTINNVNFLTNKQLNLNLKTTKDIKGNYNEDVFCNNFSEFQKEDFSDSALIINLNKCDHVIMSLLSENNQASLIILINNSENKIDLEKYDSQKNLLKTPILWINKSDGLNILNILKNKNLKNEIMISYSQKNESLSKHNLELNINFKNSNKEIFSFLKEFYKYIKNHQYLIKLNLYYLNLGCNSKDYKCSKKEIEENCINKNINTCSRNTNMNDLKLQIGVLCIIKINKLPDFIEQKDEECKKNFNLDCVEKISFKFSKKEREEFKKCSDDNLKTGKILEINNKNSEKLFPSNYATPLLKINDKFYYKKLTVTKLFETICLSFNKIPDECVFLNDKFVINDFIQKLKANREEGNKYFMIKLGVLALIILLLLSFLFYLCFKLSYNKVLKSQLNDVIKDSLTKFNTFN